MAHLVGLFWVEGFTDLAPTTLGLASQCCGGNCTKIPPLAFLLPHRPLVQLMQIKVGGMPGGKPFATPRNLFVREI